MASIHQEITLAAPPEQVWDAVRDIGALHTRLVPGFVVNTVLEEGARVVTFANGMVARELILSCDDDRRRLAWTIVGGRMTHHNGVFEVFAAPGGGTRAVWSADLLPHDLSGPIGGLMAEGMAAMQRHFAGG
jgi:carbon monoxide dehydrogenase subunit G